MSEKAGAMAVTLLVPRVPGEVMNLRSSSVAVFVSSDGPVLCLVYSCVCSWLLSPYAGFRRWNRVLPGLKASTFMCVCVHAISTRGWVCMYVMHKIVHVPDTRCLLTSYSGQATHYPECIQMIYNGGHADHELFTAVH